MLYQKLELRAWVNVAKVLEEVSLKVPVYEVDACPLYGGDALAYKDADALHYAKTDVVVAVAACGNVVQNTYEKRVLFVKLL